MPMPNLAARIWTLSNVLTDPHEQQLVETAVRDADGAWPQALPVLREQLPSESLTRLNTADTLADWSHDHASLVRALVDDTRINGLRDVALLYDVPGLTEHITPGDLPADAPGTTPADKARLFAAGLRRELFVTATTPILRQMIHGGEIPTPDSQTRGAIATFLANQPSLELRTTSVYTAIAAPDAFADIPDQDRPTVVEHLRRWQPVLALCTTPEAVPALINAGLTSAFAVAQLSEASFVRSHADTLGADVARQLHHRATDTVIRNENALAGMRDTVRGSGLAIIDGEATVNDRIAAFEAAATSTNTPINLHKLFGTIDYCECEDCLSIYSPAAYFVELLQFLRNDNLADNKIRTNPKDIKNTPLEMLLRRRPDLGCLELTCENTFTALPYIDLATEVMESFTVHLDSYTASHTDPKQATIDPFNVTDETTGELLAQPQHVNYQAYCILKNAVYPSSALPYDQPLDVARLWLPALGTTRYELLDVFRTAHETCDDVALSVAELAELDTLHAQARDRAVDAEYLQISQEQYIILTREAFWSRAYFELTTQTSIGTDAYRHKIGVRPVQEYYGYPAGQGGEDQMLDLDETKKIGLTFVKATASDGSVGQFLARTGIHYTDLVELLRTRYVNPSYPSGQALTILDSIQFSYRFLQTLVDPTDPAGKYAKLIAFLTDPDCFIPEIAALSRPDPCYPGPADPRDADGALAANDIADWINCYFERIGQLIVLDSGQGPHLPLQGGLAVVGATVFVVGLLRDDGTILGPDQKTQIGTVTYDGRAIRTDTGQPLPTLVDNDRIEITNVGDPSHSVGYIDTDGYLYADDGTEAPPRVTWTSVQDTCDLERVRLTHLDGCGLMVEEYDRLQRFIRLWRSTGWSISQTDQALAALSATPAAAGGGVCEFVGFDDYAETCPPDISDGLADRGICPDLPTPSEITPDAIHSMVTIHKLLERTGLALDTLLSFWGDIATSGDPSLYARLFLTHNVLGIDPVFKSDANGNYLTGTATLSAHLPGVLAALNLRPADAAAVIALRKLPDTLTVATVSALYRHAVLARLLGVKVTELGEVLDVFEDPFTSPDAAWQLLRDWQAMGDAGFTYRQLDYITRDHDDPHRPVGPSTRTLLQLTKTLYDGLVATAADHPDIPVDDPNTTDALVRAEVALLLDPATTDETLGLLDGTTVHTTNAPPNLTLGAIPPSLTSRLVYTSHTDPATATSTATVAVTGILTPTDTATAKALSADPGWAAALDRAAQQPRRFFRDTLAGYFPPGTNPEDTLLAGDHNPTPVTTPPPTGTPTVADTPSTTNTPTAPGKRAFFLHYFRPYLRSRLARKLVVDTVSATSGLGLDVADVLLAQVLTVGTGPNTLSALEVLEGIDQAPSQTGPGWAGLLIPPTTDTYTFVATGPATQPGAMTLDGVAVPFISQNDDPSNIWFSGPQTLQAGTLYRLDTGGLPPNQLGWRTPTSTEAAIPSSALLPDYTSAAARNVVSEVTKAALLITGFGLTADEVLYLQQHPDDFDGLDFNATTLKAWRRLRAYTTLRHSLPAPTRTLLQLFAWATAAPSDAGPTAVRDQIVAATGWDPATVASLIAAEHFDLGRPGTVRNEIALVALQKAVTVVTKTAATPVQLFAWANPTPRFSTLHTIATRIQAALRARYDQTTWEQAVKPLYDPLRTHQQAALTAYLLVQPDLRTWGVDDADGLFEFFLLDVQMSPCMQTSRIKQAISTVQTFVQRCLLGLEEARGVHAGDLDRGRWEQWMQKYVLWAANRKVYAYPENWIKPELRDDKSQFFTELEAELLQKDINPSTVTDALRNYVTKVNDIANLEVIGIYLDPPFPATTPTTTTTTTHTLHIFARTRNAPPHVYYRTCTITFTTTAVPTGTATTTVDLDWNPWEKVPVDIPDYPVETTDTTTGQVKTTADGSYLIPAVSRNRPLIFFPVILRKTAPQPAPTGTFNALNGTDVSKQQPLVYWEIRMGWSEYRSHTHTWTQKQVSTAAISEAATTTLPDINSYTFVPHVKLDPNSALSGDVVIDLYRSPAKDATTALGSFVFTGSHITVGDPPSTHDKIDATDFDYLQKSPEELHSLQRYDTDVEAGLSAVPPYFTNDGKSVTFVAHDGSTPIDAYDTIVHDLMGTLSGDTLAPFFDQYRDFNATLTDTTTDHSQAETDVYGAYTKDTATKSYHELKAPYALYNWEPAFHAPMLLVERLLAAGQFDDALAMCHYVLNPFAANTEKPFDPVWRFYPFYKTDAKSDLESLFRKLRPNTFDKSITDWRDHPFAPHVIARDRPLAYMKWVAMTYIRIWIAYGDYYFRQNTLETLPLALQCYVVASHVYGPPGELIPKRGTTRPETYLSLLDKWDAFSNAMVELELVFPFSNQTSLPAGASDGVVGLANIFGFATSLYFCIPDNPDLTALRDLIDDRLFKIRNCQDINGVIVQRPLFEAPLDPGLLVQATAQGLSLATVLADLDAPMPDYRFSYLLAKAFELCTELKSLGTAMLAAKEKHDAEALAQLRAGHDTSINSLVMEVKKQQAEEAARTQAGLAQNRRRAVYQLQHYCRLIGQDLSVVPSDATTDFTELADVIGTPIDVSGLKLMSFEKEEMDKAGTARDLQTAIGAVETLAGVFNLIPTANAHATPVGVGAALAWGGQHLGPATQAIARGLQIGVNEVSFQSTNAARMASFLRQFQDRVQQANLAGHEITGIDKQILTQEIRIAIAAQEITNQQQQIDNATQVEEFLSSKYTNTELYTYLDTQTRGLYYRAYTMAYELAKKAEKLFQFERGPDAPSFIQFGYWDPAHDGLLAGEQLYLALKKLEAAHQETCPYDFEVSKPISLRQLDPAALLQLKETGSCEFTVPEVLFDMDFPGHYQRRIRSLTVTIPAVVGPYTSLNATLRLLAHQYRHTTAHAATARAYPQAAGDDSRFTTTKVPTTAIAVSTGLEGGTEMTYRDERFLPFEGAGAISTWRLELPDPFRQFDYDTITDVILTLRYTALDGGDTLATVAKQAVQDYIKGVDNLTSEEGLFTAFDLVHEFPDEWYKALHSDPATMTLAGLADRLPLFTRGRDPKNIPAVDIYLYLKGERPPAGVTLTEADAPTEFANGAAIGPHTAPVTAFHATGQQVPMDDWALTFTPAAHTTLKIDTAWLVVRYVLKPTGGAG